MQFTQFILDTVKSEADHVRHLPHVSRVLWFDQKQLQKPGSHTRKQNIQNSLRRTHFRFLNLTALSRQV